MAPRDRGQHQSDQVDQVEVYLVTGAPERRRRRPRALPAPLVGALSTSSGPTSTTSCPPRTARPGPRGHHRAQGSHDPGSRDLHGLGPRHGLRFEPQTDAITPDAWHLRKAWLYIHAGGFEDFAWLSPGQWLGWQCGLTTTSSSCRSRTRTRPRTRKPRSTRAGSPSPQSPASSVGLDLADQLPVVPPAGPASQTWSACRPRRPAPCRRWTSRLRSSASATTV